MAEDRTEEIKRLEKLARACFDASSLIVNKPALEHLISELCEAGLVLQSVADVMKENQK